MTLLDVFSQIITSGISSRINSIQSSIDIEGSSEITCSSSYVEIRSFEFIGMGSFIPFSFIRKPISIYGSANIISSCIVIGKPTIRHRMYSLSKNKDICEGKVNSKIEYELAKREDDLLLMLVG